MYKAAGICWQPPFQEYPTGILMTLELKRKSQSRSGCARVAKHDANFFTQLVDENNAIDERALRINEVQIYMIPNKLATYILISMLLQIKPVDLRVFQSTHNLPYQAAAWADAGRLFMPFYPKTCRRRNRSLSLNFNYSHTQRAPNIACWFIISNKIINIKSIFLKLRKENLILSSVP
jgi:hypothetical protein